MVEPFVYAQDELKSKPNKNCIENQNFK